MAPISPRARIETCLHWLTRSPVAFLLCLLAGFLVYAPALQGELIWDDRYLVGENPFFRSPVFGLEVFRHYLFFDSFSTYYRPVQNWSYMLDYWLWRGQPIGYHVTNILIHSGSGFLLFSLLRRLLPGLLPPEADRERNSIGPIALLIALVWIVHPVHNAAVAYISGRADGLAALFALSAWLLAWAALEKRATWQRVVLGLLAAALLLVGLCSKEIALIWLILLLGHLFVFDRTHSRAGKLSVLAGVLAVFGCYVILHSLPEYRAPMQGGPPPQLDARILLMLRALGDYTSLLVYPGRLYMERVLWTPNMAQTRYEYLSIIGVLVLLGTIWLCRRNDAGRRLRIFGTAWFAVAFLPISNLFPLNAAVAEHWIYLASMGALLFATGAILALPGRGRTICGTLVVIALFAFGIRTSIRAGDWVNAEVFCQRTIASGGETPRILSTLAGIYGQRGELQKQEDVLRKTLVRFPNYSPTRMNLGICLANQGRAAEAEELLGADRQHADEASRLYPRTWPGALQYAVLRRTAGHPEEALAIVREARVRFPEVWELVKGESEFLRTAEGPAAALPGVEEFAARHWWHLESHMTLGRLRFVAGDSDAAIAALREASRLDIYGSDALTGIAEIEMARNRADAALEAQLEAMERDPDQPRQYAALAGILQKLGRKDKANAALRKAQLLSQKARGGS